MRSKLSDGRAASPLPVCHQGVYARLQRAMERSAFARSSRKFRVRGPLRESELREKPPSLSPSPPLWRGPLTPTLSPQAGRGSRKTRTLSSKREDIDHGARIGVFQRRRPGGSVPFRTGRDGDALLAVDRLADRPRHHAATGVEAPHLLQGLAVIGDKRALPQPGK